MRTNRKKAILGVFLSLSLALLGIVARPNVPELSAEAVSVPFDERHFAPNLGIWFVMVPLHPFGPVNPYHMHHHHHQHGARLVAFPVPMSPAFQMQLHPGDMIVSLDNLPIHGPHDVRAHHGWTHVVFINSVTGLPQASNVFLP